MSCKNCIHYVLCEYWANSTNSPYYPHGSDCVYFKDKSKTCELPCKVGDTIYRVVPDTDEYGYYVDRLKLIGYEKINEIIISQEGTFIVDNEDYRWPAEDIGKSVFLTREEAEKALKEREKNNE